MTWKIKTTPDTEEPRPKAREKEKERKRATEALLQIATPAIVTNSSKTEAAQEEKTVHLFTIKARRLAALRGVHPTKQRAKEKGLLNEALPHPGKRTYSRVINSRRDFATKGKPATTGILQSAPSFQKANVVPGISAFSYMIQRHRRRVKQNQKPRLRINLKLRQALPDC